MSVCKFLIGDVREQVEKLADGSIDLVVTSPPFIALRDYLPDDHPNKAAEIGLERNPVEFITVMLDVVARIMPKLAPHASIAIELGDTYAGSGGAGGDYYNPDGWRADQPKPAGSAAQARTDWKLDPSEGYGRGKQLSGTGGAGWPADKSKALIPELFRIALAYGVHPLTGEPSPAGRWLVRNVVTWVRTNPPVGALGDKWRPATSDIVIATLTEDRYWDEVSTRKPASPNSHPRLAKGVERADPSGKTADERRGGNWATLDDTPGMYATAPLNDWWVIGTGGYRGAHFAVFPPEIPKPLIQAMCPQQVCIWCGEPRRPIVTTTNSIGKASGRGGYTAQPGEDREMGDGFVNRNDASVPTHADKVLAGWTHCACKASNAVETCEATTWRTEVEPVLDENTGEPMLNRKGKPKTRRVRVVDNPGHCADPDGHHRRGVVLDPFGGSGTTGSVAVGLGRDAVLIDLDERNADLALERVGPLFFQLGE